MSSGVQHKLLGHEVTPPPGAWNKIAAELDDSELHHVFPSKLYEAEIAAPAGTWNNIQAALNAEEEIVAPKRRAIAPWLRYAAAAVILGFIAWGGIQLLNNKEDKTVAITTDTTPEKQSPEVPSPVITMNGEPIINTDKTDEARDARALEESKKTFARLDLPARTNRLKNIASAYRFASNAEMEDEDGLYASERDPADLNDRYIVLMTPDGHFVRMSKRLSNMVCCVSGEEQDKDCIDQMSNWKAKMACSPTGHSTGSFLDILNLIKSLEDK